jgi:general secretion pathway protein F
MPHYRYQAVTPAGELVQGEMDAGDEAAVVARIQHSGQIPLGAKRVAARLPAWFAVRPSMSRHELAVFTRELAVLLHAGVPLDRALQLVVELSPLSTAGRQAAAIEATVRGGAALSEALQRANFARFYVSMVRAAEAAGTLDAGLARLAEHEERAKALRDGVVTALIYPAILVAVAGGSLLVILAWVVPQFTQLFAQAGRALPLSTQLVVGAAALLKNYWWLLAAGVVAAVFGWRLLLASARGCHWRDRALLGLPLVGGLLQRIQMARFSRGLGTLLASGVPLLAGVSIVKDMVSSGPLSDALDAAAEALQAGRGLADPLLASGLFPGLGLQMIKVGEQTARLDEMLLRVAELYEREVAAATQRILALLEPVLIVGLGVVIAAVIMSILVAIVSINDLPL